MDVGLLHFYTDNQGSKVENPRHIRKSEKVLKRLQRRVSSKVKGSNKRKKAINKLGRKYLKVSRQRKDFAMKLARCVVTSNDVVVFEALRVWNMVKNRHLAKKVSTMLHDECSSIGWNTMVKCWQDSCSSTSTMERKLD